MMEEKPTFTIVEVRVEQWLTEYSIKELGITGIGYEGLIENLAIEVWTLRNKTKSLEQNTLYNRILASIKSYDKGA